jgi:hypothetical protein
MILNARSHFILCPISLRQRLQVSLYMTQVDVKFLLLSFTSHVNPESIIEESQSLYARALELTLLACANRNLQQVNVNLHALVHPSSCAMPSLMLRSAILSFSIA